MVRLSGESNITENVELRLLKPSKLNPRTKSGDIDELVRSIAQVGLLQPLIVRVVDDGFEVIAGNRRLEACRRLGHTKVPCQIVDVSDSEAFSIALTENIQRQTLDPVEEALAFKKYVVERAWGGITQLAKTIGKSQEYVSQRLLLLNLPKEILDRLVSHELSSTVARELVSIRNSSQQMELAELAIARQLSSRKASRAISLVKSGLGVKEAIALITADSNNSPAHPELSTFGRSTKGEESKRDKDVSLLQRSILTLRLSMFRIDSMIAELDDDSFLREFLMRKRYELHEMIDDLIHLKNNVEKAKTVRVLE
jgi:ParB family chromosome partitioning protein